MHAKIKTKENYDCSPPLGARSMYLDLIVFMRRGNRWLQYRCAGCQICLKQNTHHYKCSEAVFMNFVDLTVNQELQLKIFLGNYVSNMANDLSTANI